MINDQNFLMYKIRFFLQFMSCI